MEEIGFYTNLITGDHVSIPGLDDLNVLMTQGTQETNGVPSEVQQVDDEVQARPSAGHRSSTKGLSKRTKNFDDKEDLVVCSAWLNVSKDPIHGANQTRSSFWSRVRALFEEHRETPYSRSESSIMHRWLIIQKEVNKFCACYEAIERRNQSGATIQDMISQALEMFQGIDQDKKPFTLIPCWTKLKEQDKWKAKRKELAEQQKQGSKKKQRINTDSTPRDVEANNTEEVQGIALPVSEERKRGPGQKKAKEALRWGSGDACTEALDKMWAKKEAFDREKEKAKQERFMASLELENKRLSNEEKKAEADLIKEENQIMSMDMSSLTPLQYQYYETMQQKIVARRLSN